MAVYCIVWMVNTFLKYSLISGAILKIYFAIFCQVKELWNISEKDWLNLSNWQFLLSFFTHKKHPRGASIHEIKESFPLKPSLVYMALNLTIFFYREQWLSTDKKLKSRRPPRKSQWIKRRWIHTFFYKISIIFREIWQFSIRISFWLHLPTRL